MDCKGFQGIGNTAAQCCFKKLTGICESKMEKGGERFINWILNLSVDCTKHQISLIVMLNYPCYVIRGGLRDSHYNTVPAFKKSKAYLENGDFH